MRTTLYCNAWSQAKEENKFTANEEGIYIRDKVVPGIKF